MRASIALAVAVAASTIGCNDRDRVSPPASLASAAPRIVPVAPPPSASAPSPHVGAPSSRLAQCPGAVVGATTALRDVERGIELVITADDDAAVAEIRARAAALVVAGRDPSLQEKHGSGTGGGGGGGSGGGGSSGRCPVVMKRTTVDARDVAHGSAIVVVARNAENVDWLRRETRERQDEVAIGK